MNKNNPYKKSHIVNLISERSIEEQKLVLQGILEYFSKEKLWDTMVTFASCLPRDSKMGRLWGGYGEASFNYRNKMVKRFFNEILKRANHKLRSKHMPYLFVHEYRPADKDSTMYSGHCHAVYGINHIEGKERRNTRHDTLGYSLSCQILQLAKEYRKDYGIEVHKCGVYNSDLTEYMSKYVNYSKDLNMNYGMHRLICENERGVDRKIKDMFIEHQEMIKELRKKAYFELNHRYPCYKKESFIN